VPGFVRRARSSVG